MVAKRRKSRVPSRSPTSIVAREEKGYRDAVFDAYLKVGRDMAKYILAGDPPEEAMSAAERDHVPFGVVSISEEFAASARVLKGLRRMQAQGLAKGMAAAMRACAKRR